MSDPAVHHVEGQLSALVDDPDFRVINERLSRFNLFEAVGAVRGELRHSNFLGYLLSPNRPHGLGSRPLQRVLRAMLEAMAPASRPIMTLELLVGELDDAVVYRERDNIDLLIELPTLKLVVVIENKVDAKAGLGQLARYKAVADARYPGHKQLLVFLTPHGAAPDHADYVAFSYATLATVLEEFCADDLRVVGSEAHLIIRHYVEMLRRHIVQDDHLRDLAIRLYERHSEAFDFIFDARPAPQGLVDVIRDCALNCQGLLADGQGGNLFRFIPEAWEGEGRPNRCDPAKWSKSGRGLLFEAKTYAGTPGRVNISLIVGPCDGAFREHLYKAALDRPALFQGISKPMGGNHATIYSRDFLTPDQAKGLSFEAKANNVSLAWGDFQGGDLMALIGAVNQIEAEYLASASPASAV